MRMTLEWNELRGAAARGCDRVTNVSVGGKLGSDCGVCGIVTVVISQTPVVPGRTLESRNVMCSHASHTIINTAVYTLKSNSTS